MNDLIQWMENHEKLSGWAQAVGAFTAIGIAIALPAFQTRIEMLRRKRADLQEKIAVWRGLFFLMSDAETWVGTIIMAPAEPKHDTQLPHMFEDITERMRIWEARAKEPQALLHLGAVRTCLNLSMGMVRICEEKTKKLDEMGLAMLVGHIKSIHEAMRISHREVLDADSEIAISECIAPLRHWKRKGERAGCKMAQEELEKRLNGQLKNFEIKISQKAKSIHTPQQPK